MRDGRQRDRLRWVGFARRWLPDVCGVPCLSPCPGGSSTCRFHLWFLGQPSASPKASAVTSRAHRCWGRPCPRGCELLPPHPRPNSLPECPVRALLWDWRNGERLAVANPIPHRHALALWQFQSTCLAFLSLTIEQKQTCTAPLNAQDENILPVPLVTGSAPTLASRPRQLLETPSLSPAPLRTLLLLRNPHCILPHPPIFTLSPT